MGGAAHAVVASLNDAINKAGRQRMLSQRMAKAWLAMGQGVHTQHAEGILQESVALFDRQLVELKAYAPSPDIRTTYATLEPVWSDYKTALIGSAPDKRRVSPLLDLDAKLLKLAQLGTVQLETHSGKAVGNLVNLAGRQRMLSQRSAKLYLCQAWGTATPSSATELKTARQEFSQALRTLMGSPQVTSAIKDQLSLAEQQWIFFDNALGRLNDVGGSTQHANDVFATSENILKVMDKVTGMFSQLS